VTSWPQFAVLRARSHDLSGAVHSEYVGLPCAVHVTPSRRYTL